MDNRLRQLLKRLVENQAGRGLPPFDERLGFGPVTHEGPAADRYAQHGEAMYRAARNSRVELAHNTGDGCNEPDCTYCNPQGIWKLPYATRLRDWWRARIARRNLIALTRAFHRMPVSMKSHMLSGMVAAMMPDLLAKAKMAASGDVVLEQITKHAAASEDGANLMIATAHGMVGIPNWRELCSGLGLKGLEDFIEEQVEQMAKIHETATLAQDPPDEAVASAVELAKRIAGGGVEPVPGESPADRQRREMLAKFGVHMPVKGRA